MYLQIEPKNIALKRRDKLKVGMLLVMVNSQPDIDKQHMKFDSVLMTEPGEFIFGHDQTTQDKVSAEIQRLVRDKRMIVIFSEVARRGSDDMSSLFRYFTNEKSAM